MKSDYLTQRNPIMNAIYLTIYGMKKIRLPWKPGPWRALKRKPTIFIMHCVIVVQKRKNHFCQITPGTTLMFPACNITPANVCLAICMSVGNQYIGKKISKKIQQARNSTKRRKIKSEKFIKKARNENEKFNKIEKTQSRNLTKTRNEKFNRNA